MPNYKRYYLNNHYVFITVITYNRNPILIKNIDLLRESFKQTTKVFDFEIFGSVIIPEHFHVIIRPKDISEFSKIIGSIKKRFSYNLNEKFIDNNISESRTKRSEKGVWQRRFYEHIVRSDEELYKILDYIHYNPVKHGHVQNVKDWEYSSFHKFVKKGNYEANWGSCSKDYKHFEDLDYE